eukprot:727382-Prymnesium_polylepis.1
MKRVLWIVGLPCGAGNNAAEQVLPGSATILAVRTVDEPRHNEQLSIQVPFALAGPIGRNAQTHSARAITTCIGPAWMSHDGIGA